MCSCHYPRMLCHVFWNQVEYKIVCFISGLLVEIWSISVLESLVVLVGLLINCLNPLDLYILLICF